MYSTHTIINGQNKRGSSFHSNIEKDRTLGKLNLIPTGCKLEY